MALLTKRHSDANLQKHLATLPEHPSLLKRCKQFYLERLISGCTFAELGGKHGVHEDTAWKYVHAYKKLVKAQGGDGLDMEDIIAYIRYEITSLIPKGELPVTPSERAVLSRTRMGWQAMLNELKGLVDRKPQVNIQINQVVKGAVDTIDRAFREALQEHGLNGELMEKILASTARRISLEGAKPEVGEASGNAPGVCQAVLPGGDTPAPGPVPS